MSFTGLLEVNRIYPHGTPTAMSTLAKSGSLVAPSPSTGFWAGCPALYYNDPSSFYSFFDDFMFEPLSSSLPINWQSMVDTSGTIAIGAGAGGQIVLTTHTDATDAAAIQAGTAAAPFMITKDSGKKLWFETKVKIGAHTNIEGVFVGLGSAGLTATDAVITDTTGVLAESTYLAGFRIITGTPAVWDPCWKRHGQTIGTTTATNTTAEVALCVNNDDFHTFGIYFDGVNTVTYYVNGTALSTTVAANAAAFPYTVGLAPLYVVKTHTGAQALTIDWVKVVQLR